jgi:putative sterol carrier protein
VRELLEKTVERFNEKAKADEKLRNELTGIQRTVLLDLKDGTMYNFILKDAHVDGVNEGAVDSPDITIIADRSTLEALFRREIGPMKAIALQKLKVRASIEDMLRLRKFF